MADTVSDRRAVPITREGEIKGYMIECPGCDMPHQFDHRWTFNGDMEKPTFFPSLKVTWTHGGSEKRVCHSFVRNGKIEYLKDCTHSMAGQTVDLPVVTFADGNT